MTTEDFLKLARSFSGLCAVGPTAAKYAEIMHGETARRIAEMIREYSCGLLGRHLLWLAFGADAHEFAAPYVDSTVFARIMTWAGRMNIIRAPTYRPRPGDMVLVGGDGSGPQHLWTMLEDGGLGLDGGELDHAAQATRERKHRLVAGYDYASPTDLAPAYVRRVVAVFAVSDLLDMEAA